MSKKFEYDYFYAGQGNEHSEYADRVAISVEEFYSTKLSSQSRNGISYSQETDDALKIISEKYNVNHQLLISIICIR